MENLWPGCHHYKRIQKASGTITLRSKGVLWRMYQNSEGSPLWPNNFKTPRRNDGLFPLMAGVTCDISQGVFCQQWYKVVVFNICCGLGGVLEDQHLSGSWGRTSSDVLGVLQRRYVSWFWPMDSSKSRALLKSRMVSHFLNSQLIQVCGLGHALGLTSLVKFSCHHVPGLMLKRWEINQLVASTSSVCISGNPNPTRKEAPAEASRASCRWCWDPTPGSSHCARPRWTSSCCSRNPGSFASPARSWSCREVYGWLTWWKRNC